MPALSVVIPVYNEEAGLEVLFARLYPALDALKESYEIVFVDDGSKDKSVAILREQFRRQNASHAVRQNNYRYLLPRDDFQCCLFPFFQLRTEPIPLLDLLRALAQTALPMRLPMPRIGIGPSWLNQET